MQNSGDAALAAAVNATDRYIVHKLEIDWARNGLYSHALSNLTAVVKSIEISRDTNSSLPNETTMTEGYMAAQMRVTLGGRRPGDTDPIANALSPWNQSSSLFGDGKLTIPIRAFIGHRVASGTETLVQQFQGVISEFNADSRSGVVTLSCLDNADTLRASIDLPLFALENGGSGNPISDWRINSQWVVDYVLRRNGIYMSPPPHARAIWSCTCHGAVIPEIGWQAFHASSLQKGIPRTEDDPVTYSGRPGWGLAYGGDTRATGPVVYSRARPGPTMKSGDSIAVQSQIDTSYVPKAYWNTSGVFLIYGTGDGIIGGSGSGNNQLQFGISPAGQQFVNVLNDTTTIQSVFSPGAIPLTGFQDVWYRVDFGTPLSASTITFSHGGSAAVNLSALSTGAAWPFPCVGCAPIWPMHDIQVYDVTGLAAGAALYNPGTWVPQADIDAGLLTMTGLPLRRGVGSWDLLKELVAAEYGVVGFSEAGRFFFKNRDTLKRQGLTVETTLTSDKLITDMALSERTGAVRNVITAKVVPRLITAYSIWTTTGADAWDWVFQLTDPNTMVSGPGTNAFQVSLDSPSWTEDTRGNLWVHQEPAGPSWPPTGLASSSAFMAVRQGVVTSEQTGVLVSVTTLPPEYGYDQILIQVYNPGVNPIIFATTQGNPAFWLTGRKYSRGNETQLTVQRASSITRYGSRTLELPESDWQQEERPTSNVARSLLRDLRAPVPTVQNLAAVGDCRLQLQDTAVIQDTGVLGGPMYTTLTGITRSLTVDQQGAKLVDQLDVRPFAAPGKWILGHPTWSVLGQTTKL